MSAHNVVSFDPNANDEFVTQETPARDLERWIEAIRRIAESYRLPMSEQSARLSAAWSGDETPEAVATDLARSAGLVLNFQEPDISLLSYWQLPVVIQLVTGEVGIVRTLNDSGQASVVFSGNAGLETPLHVEELIKQVALIAIARPSKSAPDERVDGYIKPVVANWLTRTILPDLKPYTHVMLASLVTSLLALVSTLFSMQVYDRVIPAASISTLYVLFGGVMIAIAIDFLMRRARTDVVDILGKKADIRLSDAVLGRALRIKNRNRPPSTGTFINQIRDLEQVRDMFTSTTVTAMADLPFFLLFLFFYWMIAGSLIFIPVVAAFLIVIPGLLVAKFIRAHAQDAMRESSLRNALLVETIQGIEDIKGLQAEERFQQQWTYLTTVTSDSQMRLRRVTGTMNAWIQSVQTGVFAVTILVGAQMVMAGDMTTGALVGASILGSRMMAPVASIATLITRAQHARIAMNGLDQLMRLPLDHAPDEHRIHVPAIQGKYEITQAQYRYGAGDGPVALSIQKLNIEPNERLAVLGRTGSGKSTLLQALSGMMEPSSGHIFLDDMALGQIDPADVRRDVGYLGQTSRLFHGSLRENLLLGAAAARQSDMFNVLDLVGASDFVRRLPKGLDYRVQEGGAGLSGGQKQLLLLARVIIKNPRVLLLDEPSASMDETTERQFTTNMAAWSAGRTLVVATHRMRILDMVDRVLVIDNRRIILDEPKEVALKTLKGGSPSVDPAAASGSVAHLKEV